MPGFGMSGYKTFIRGFWLVYTIFVFLWDLHHDKDKKKCKLFSSLLFRHVKIPTLLKLYNTNKKKHLWVGEGLCEPLGMLEL